MVSMGLTIGGVICRSVMCFHGPVMRIPRAVIASLAASALLIAACGGDGGDEGA